jgi:hypothetical protein
MDYSIKETQSMKKPTSSLAIGVCLLALSAGVAFADNLHNPSVTGGPATTGQTGTQGAGTGKPAIAGCGGTAILGNVGGMMAKTNNGVGSPFNAVTGSSKKYAGAGAGNSGSNPNANAQYDNACAQAQLH